LTILIRTETEDGTDENGVLSKCSYRFRLFVSVFVDVQNCSRLCSRERYTLIATYVRTVVSGAAGCVGAGALSGAIPAL
jgi:hypothetical protein